MNFGHASSALSLSGDCIVKIISTGMENYIAPALMDQFYDENALEDAIRAQHRKLAGTSRLVAERRYIAELMDLVPFLQALAMQGNKDFPEVLGRYGNKNVGSQYQAKIKAHEEATASATAKL